MLLDSDTMVESVSDGIAAVGYSSGELAGRNLSEILSPVELAAWVKYPASGARPPALEEHPSRLRHHDGHWVRVDILGVTRHPDTGQTALALRLAPGAITLDPIQSLTLATEQSPAAVIVTDLQGSIRYVNRRFTEMTGYDREEVLGRNPRLLKSGQTDDTTYRDLWSTIAAGTVWRGELCNRRKNGELYWHSASISPVRDEAGAVAGFVAVQEDITELRRNREALAIRERDLRRILDTALEGIWRVDADHRTTFVNEALSTLLGYSAEEMLGRSVFDFTDGEGRAIAEASLERRRRGIRERLDFKLRRRDGTAVWVLMSTGPILDDQGRYAGAMAMVTDVTARREAELAVRRSEAWFRALIEGAEDLTAVLTPEGIIRYASPSHQRVLGYRPEELEGQRAFDLVHPEDVEPVVRMFAEGMSRAGAVRTLHYRFRHANGEWRWIEGVGRNLSDDPVVQGAVVNGRDVTERRTLESQLLQVQKIEAVGRLVAGVAHDFNNLLTVILGGVDTLRLDLGPDHAGAEELAEIGSAGSRAAALTRQLLAFSRQQILLPRALDLNALIRDMERMLTRVLRDDILLETRLTPAPTTVMADPGQLEQVLLNLAVNSRDAMPEGGRLLIETAVMDLDEEAAGAHEPMRPGPHVTLAVTDTGTGMTSETRARAFDPFFTTKAPGSGTGLGLATVYGIVKQSGGFIWLYSEPGQGTTVRVYLPRVAEMPAAPELPTQQPEHLQGTETVLLVEDNPAVRQFARRVLRKHGYHVVEAEGPEALAFADREVSFDLLLTDVVMAGVTGPTLASHLREKRPDLAVLFTSGYADAPERIRLAEAGSSFLPKPFTATELLRKVREVLGRASGGGG